MSTGGGRSELVDITPHPRVLAMLGEIAFEPHKCIGELVDNAIDGFLSQTRFLQETHGMRPEIIVRVPHKSQIETGGPILSGAEVTVEDNGPGMTLSQLTRAAQAGYSGTASLENLGLFGMGFNIATARLGGLTELRSGVRGESRWSILDIDLAGLRSNASYLIRPRFESKSSNDSGTRVTIRNLRHEQVMQIASGIPGNTKKSVAGLRSWIGRTYSKYLREDEPRLGTKKLTVVVNGEPVRPFRWCVWGENRYVEVGSDARPGLPNRIPAFKRFDDVLGVGYYCTSCLSWQPDATTSGERCSYCGSDTVIERSRRMRGWIGVQRHLHDDEFGFDFLRNGRAILQWDKRCFSWTDPDTGKTELEYPIDEIRARHGRIVGEIEIDHVPVHYQKDSFEEESWLWREVIYNLRGRGPLQRSWAHRHNMPPNDSLLSDIYRGYNRTRTEEGGRFGGSRERRDSWAKDLIISQDVALRYHQKFLEGEPAYQSDSKWYEWMIEADRERVMRQAQQAEGEGGPAPEITGGAAAGEAPKGERERLQQKAELYTELSGTYGFEPQRTLEVNVYRVREHMMRQHGAISHAVPVVVFATLRGVVDCFYDETHPRIEHEEADVRELVLAEIAIVLQERYYDHLPVSFVYDHLRKAVLPDTSVESLRRNALRLIDELWPRFGLTYKASGGGAAKLKDVLSRDEMRQLSLVVAEQGRDQAFLDRVLETGEFLRIMPQLLSRILREKPEIFLDDQMFAIAYNQLPEELTEEARTTICRDNVSRIANLLEDVANATRHVSLGVPQIERLSRLRAFRSVDLVREYLVAT